jgi:diphthamide synthase (EF-2-diphthine--ammonia ligase)
MPLVEKIKAAGADPCGENGEYHTFVYDGPMFQYPVSFETGEIIDFEAYKIIDIKHRV